MSFHELILFIYRIINKIWNFWEAANIYAFLAIFFLFCLGFLVYDESLWRGERGQSLSRDEGSLSSVIH